ELSMPEGKIDPTDFLQDLAVAEADTMGLRRELLDKQPQLKSWLWLPAAHNRWVMLNGAISSQAKAEVEKLRMGPTDTFHTLESALYKVAGEFDWGNLSSSASDSSSEEEELPPIRIKREKPSRGGTQPTVDAPIKVEGRKIRPPKRRKAVKLATSPKQLMPMAVVPSGAHPVGDLPRTNKERLDYVLGEIEGLKLQIEARGASAPRASASPTSGHTGQRQAAS
ncbi:MAG: hypothetical protein GY737_10960, partial [Desulfobacteraceae bacterium]|nr:hypothetical protein [Desulfobacteraceae bacterium]